MIKKVFPNAIAVIILSFVLAGSVSATTWFPKEFECPIDKTKNTFLVIGSYGSYIYSYPSKYQWLFFPRTDSPTFYLCKKCHLATYMWDFDELPKDKLDEIRKILTTIKSPKIFKDYNEVPVTQRLEIMEKVYAILGKSDNWWENFYRVEGYHYAAEKQYDKAAEARKKSLELLSKELKLKDVNDDTPKKLLFYISGAMKHFLNDDKGAVEDFQKGLDTKYQKKDAQADELKDAEEGMNERIKDYIKRIRSDKKPRLTDTQNDYP